MGIYNLKIRNQQGIWRKIFPRRRTIIGTSAQADILLSSNPVEFNPSSPKDLAAQAECLRTLGNISHWGDPSQYCGISAEFYCDFIGRLKVRSIQPREKSHIYINQIPVGKEGMLLEDKSSFITQPELRIGKFRFTFISNN